MKSLTDSEEGESSSEEGSSGSSGGGILLEGSDGVDDGAVKELLQLVLSERDRLRLEVRDGGAVRRRGDGLGGLLSGVLDGLLDEESLGGKSSGIGLRVADVQLLDEG